MPIRFKTETSVQYSCVSWPHASCISIVTQTQVPIRDWSGIPTQINAPDWMIGAANPAPISLQITFPELEYIYPDPDPNITPNFRYKIKKIFTGVDFINITSDTGALTGNVFNAFNLVQETIKVNFQNMNNLSVGIHQLDLVFEAYRVDSGGNEIFKEDSTIQNIIVPVTIKVLSGNSFNTDKNSYQIIYNIADDSLSGDAQIVVYSADNVVANPSDPFINLTQNIGNSERYLVFQNNPALQGKAVGNYSGSVTITKGVQSKTVTVDLQVINDATQFYVSPTNFNISLQKNLSESKTVIANIANPNNLSITVDIMPSFIESVNISNNVVTIITKNSSTLLLGNYSGDIILKSGSVQKIITVNLTVLQAITHDFSGSLYYFSLDKNKVIVNKTSASSAYVKMTLSMYFKGYGEEYQESQIYTIPFFKGSAEIYPGEEVQDFFIKAKDLDFINDPVYAYDLALVTMTFQEMSSTDQILSTFSLDNVRFAPGKRPKCFPFFTNYGVRSTYSDSVIKLNFDRISEKNEANLLYNQYDLPKPSYVKKFTVDQYYFLRNKFKPELQNFVISNNILQFIPLPEPENTVHIEWENQNLVFDWFTAVEKTKETAEIEAITGESRYYREEKFDSSYSKLLTVSSGWILREEVDLITDLLLSRICFIYIKGIKYKAFPIGKKNELKDSDNNTFSMDLEFKILIEK